MYLDQMGPTDWLHVSDPAHPRAGITYHKHPRGASIRPQCMWHLHSVHVPCWIQCTSQSNRSMHHTYCGTCSGTCTRSGMKWMDNSQATGVGNTCSMILEQALHAELSSMHLMLHMGQLRPTGSTRGQMIQLHRPYLWHPWINTMNGIVS